MNQPPPQGGFPPPGQFPQHGTQPEGGFAQPAPQGQYPSQPQMSPPGGGGGGGSGMGGGGGMSSAQMDQKKAEAAGFLRSLFDFKFENFVSPRVLKVMYGLYLFMLVPSLFGLFAVWYQALTHEGYDYETREYSSDPEFGVFCGATVAYPLFVFMWILLGRVIFERGILAFRQYDLNREMLEELKRR